MSIKVGSVVKILTGNQSGKTFTVSFVNKKKKTVLLKGLFYSFSISVDKADGRKKPEQKMCPIHISNVSLVS